MNKLCPTTALRMVLLKQKRVHVIKKSRYRRTQTKMMDTRALDLSYSSSSEREVTALFSKHWTISRVWVDKMFTKHSSFQILLMSKGSREPRKKLIFADFLVFFKLRRISQKIEKAFGRTDALV